MKKNNILFRTARSQHANYSSGSEWNIACVLGKLVVTGMKPLMRNQHKINMKINEQNNITRSQET